MTVECSKCIVRSGIRIQARLYHFFEGGRGLERGTHIWKSRRGKSTSALTASCACVYFVVIYVACSLLLHTQIYFAFRQSFLLWIVGSEFYSLSMRNCRLTPIFHNRKINIAADFVCGISISCASSYNFSLRFLITAKSFSMLDSLNSTNSWLDVSLGEGAIKGWQRDEDAYSWMLLQLFALFRLFLRVCCKKTRLPVQGFVQCYYIAVAGFCLIHEKVAKV